MTAPRSPLLFAAGACSLAAALMHLACIAGGPSWYRALGAGERIASMAAAGSPRPMVMTLTIAAVLSLWGLYAWSGAGVVRRLPLLRTGLVAITAVYLARGIFFLPLMPRFPGNSMTFWYVSSGICVAIGLLHLGGLRQAWARL